MAAGKEVATVALEIPVEFAVQALQLGVVDGCIESIALGQLEVSATVECEGKQLKELSFRKFDAPAEHHFEHPISISGTNRCAASTAVKAEVQVLWGVRAEPAQVAARG